MFETTQIDKKLSEKEKYRMRRKAGKRGQGDKPVVKIEVETPGTYYEGNREQHRKRTRDGRYTNQKGAKASGSSRKRPFSPLHDPSETNHDRVFARRTLEKARNL